MSEWTSTGSGYVTRWTREVGDGTRLVVAYHRPWWQWSRVAVNDQGEELEVLASGSGQVGPGGAREVADRRVRIDDGEWVADLDAEPIDEAIMGVAEQLRRAGHTDAAQHVADQAAFLRETPRAITAAPTTLALVEALETMSSACTAIALEITENYPDEIALQARGGA